jgi:hypothetical protein
VTLCGDTHQAQQTLKNQQFAVFDRGTGCYRGLSGVEWIRSLRQQGGEVGYFDAYSKSPSR